MAYVERTALLGELIGAALRNPAFQAKASALSVWMIRQAVEEELAAKGVPVTVIDVDALSEGSPGAYEVVWQAEDRGKFQRQWFKVDVPLPPAREDAN